MNSAVASNWPAHTGLSHVLCLGAHPDDIEIGCAGTLLRMLESSRQIRMSWVVFTAGDDSRRREAEASARQLVGSALADFRSMTFAERYLPYDPDLKRYFDQLGAELDPDLVLAPRTADLHQDHRVIGELAWNTFRRQPIWEYEIVKYEGDLGHPNLFVSLTRDQIDRKIDHLVASFPSQAGRLWFTEDTFRSLARIRGIEARATEGYAEAFQARKVVF